MITFNTLGRHGQLGNQMFQYALLQGISSKRGVEVAFTPEIIKSSYLFNIFKLSNYSINLTEIKKEYREPKFDFNNEVFNLDNISYFGYFQSEKYFNHCKELISREFTFNDHIVSNVNSILAPYKDKKLVSVHIRRGDYLINPDYHPLPNIEYYNTAMDLLDGEDTHFICVSNDPDWCKSNIVRPNLTYHYNNLDIDMCLISNCHHHIIANSSFSWWGSWLSPFENKKVYAPPIWFGPRASDLNVKDLYRDEFIVL